MGQDALFGMVDGDARMFDADAYRVSGPSDVQRPRSTGPSLAEQSAEAQRVHDLWAERLSG